ncbi:MAG: HEAT repeat domain-containing protein [Myxococcota bacterium]
MRCTFAVVLTLSFLLYGFEWEGRLTRLRQDYEAGDAARRREVVRLWSSYPASAVGESVLLALSDPDAGVRAEAASAAGRIRLADAVPRLLDWLDEQDADVRASAVTALGSIGDDRTVPSLVRTLGDSNADVRRAAVTALSTIGGPDVIIPLLGRLDDTDSSVRGDAAEALGRLADPRAVVPLVGRARDDVPEVRVAVYDALGSLDDPRALPALLQGLRDDAEAPQLAAIRATGRLGNDGGVEALENTLRTEDERQSRAAVAALGNIGTEAATVAIVEALERGPTRAIAIEVLTDLSRRDDADALDELLVSALQAGGSNPYITAVAQTIAQIGGHRPVEAAAPALLSAFQRRAGQPQVLLDALASTGSETALVPILEQLQESTTLDAALSALERYFERRPPDGRAADPLLAALGRVQPGDRSRVVRLLGRVRAARALPELRPLLNHSDSELRRAAVRAIGAIGDPEGADALFGLLTDRDAETRYEASRAFGRAASAAGVRRLLTRIRAPEPFDRNAGLTAVGIALRKLQAEGTLDPETTSDARSLLVLLGTSEDESLFARAMDVAATWGHRPLAADLGALFASATPRRQRAIAYALAAIGGEDAHQVLFGAYGDAPRAVRAALVMAIAETGGEADIAFLLDAAEAEPWPTNAAAAFGLQRLAAREVLTLTDDRRSRLCSLAARRQPFLRANIASALAALGAPPCDGGVRPERWLSTRHNTAVRSAAIRWLHAAAEAGRISRDDVNRTLAECAERDLSPEVARICREPAPPPRDDVADVYAYSADGRTLLADRWVALRFADGSVWVAKTDVNGHLRLQRAPRGPLILDDPSSIPLEP